MSSHPLVNHPPRLSDLHGRARIDVLTDRADAARRRHQKRMAAERRPWWRRLFALAGAPK